jgi:hypothetical protein
LSWFQVSGSSCEKRIDVEILNVEIIIGSVGEQELFMQFRAVQLELSGDSNSWLDVWNLSFLFKVAVPVL